MGEVEGGGSGPYVLGGEFSGEEGGESSGEGVGLGKKRGLESEKRLGRGEEGICLSGILRGCEGISLRYMELKGGMEV